MTVDARIIADRYRLEQQIGAGAMGVVWRAHDKRLDRIVAVKQLLMQPGLGEVETQAATARAMREGRIAARLQHPNAISVYDVALDDIDDSGTGSQPVPWLIMEYLPSRSLAAVLIERGTLPPQEVARIGRQVAAALTAAHRAGIVHRDVKPGNVLIGADGIVKITDFGISRASWEAAVTRTGVVAGTPAYFAPEVARGEPRDPPADVFSLGSTLYAAVEGAPPFGLDDNTLALIRTVAEGRVKPPQQAGRLSALLMRMLRDDPAQRPSMSETMLALGVVAGGGSRAWPVRRAAWHPKQAPVGVPAIPAQAMRPAVEALPHPPRPETEAAPQIPAVDGEARGATRRRRHAALLGLLVCVEVLLGVFALATEIGRETQTVGVPGPLTTTAPAPALPEPAKLEQIVRTYYGLLPGDIATAWEFLGAPERAKSGSFAGYEEFWNGIDGVGIRGPVTVSGDTVQVNLQFERKNQQRTFERYQLTMGTTSEGRVLIESAVRTGTFTPSAANGSDDGDDDDGG
ncbi:MAG: serine/threonine-protein kinase [Pseudonocardiaceae bacterium]